MATYRHLRVAHGQATTAEVNAGKVIVADEPGRTLTVTDAWLRAIGGNAATVDTVDIVTNGGTTKAVTFARANLTQNTVLRAGATGTVNTNLLAKVTHGKGLKVYKTGSDLATATAIDYHVEYVVE